MTKQTDSSAGAAQAGETSSAEELVAAGPSPGAPPDLAPVLPERPVLQVVTAPSRDAPGPAAGLTPRGRALWPSTLPDLKDALEVLRGQKPSPATLVGTTRRVRAEHSDIEQDALDGEGLPFNATPFRNALATRWRLAAALDTAPEQPEHIDKDALNDLLAEVDLVLDGLKLLGNVSPEPVRAAIEGTRTSLVRDAVNLSERLQAGAMPAPASAPEQPARKAVEGAGKLVILSGREAALEGKLRRRRQIQIAVLVLAVAGAVGYQLAQRGKDFKPPPTVAGAPAGIGVVQDRRGALIVNTVDGQPPSSAVAEWLQKHEDAGRKVKKLGPGIFVVAPAEKPKAAAP